MAPAESAAALILLSACLQVPLDELLPPPLSSAVAACAVEHVPEHVLEVLPEEMLQALLKAALEIVPPERLEAAEAEE